MTNDQKIQEFLKNFETDLDSQRNLSDENFKEYLIFSLKKSLEEVLQVKDQEKALEDYKKELREKIEKKNPDKDEMLSFRLGYRVAKSEILPLIK